MTAIRTLMLGIDAADLDFIQRHSGRLPVLQRLMRQGTLHGLESTSRLLTGSVWPTFYTGTHPGVHGIYHHLQWDPTRMRTRRVAHDWLPCEPFWYEMVRRGTRVTVVDVPMALPSRLESGSEVVNWGSHDQLGPLHANRPELQKEIRVRFGRHPMGAEIPVTKTLAELGRIRRNLVEGAALKGRLIQHLLASTEWDFFLAVFGECHRGGHVLWPEASPDSLIQPDALIDVYQAVDTALGRILAAIDPAATRVVVFSLHGMGPNTSQEHFVRPVMQRLYRLHCEGSPLRPGRPPGQRSLMGLLRRRLPGRVQNAIARAVPVTVRDWVVSRATTGGYNWETTPCFPLLADLNGYLRLNLKGREVSGCLERQTASYCRYREWLDSSWRELCTSDGGEAVVEDVVAMAEVFPGPRSDQLPDLVVTWRDLAPQLVLRSALVGSIRGRLDTGRSGNHRHQGFALVQGPAVEGGVWEEVSHIQHLARVVGRLHGVPARN